MISVIVPVYNAENNIVECVNSIEKQKYKDLEVFLINDGSTDSSGLICERLAEKYNNIRYIYQNNSGVSVARNKGLYLSKGEWISFIDSDDRISQDFFNRLIKRINNNTDIVCCCAYDFDNNNICEDHFFKENFIARSKEEKQKLFIELFDSGGKDEYHGKSGVTAIGVPWGKLYRKSFLYKNNLKFNPELKRMQDNVFNMFAFHFAREIIYIDEPLYMYRIEHIKSSKLISLENSLKIIEEREHFIDTFSYRGDTKILKANILGKKHLMVSSLMNMGQYSLSTIMKKIRLMALSKEYSDYIRTDIKEEELKVKIAKSFIRSRQYFILAIAIKIYSTFKD